MENNQAILNELLKAINLTRAGNDVRELKYDEERELVLVYFGNSTTPGRQINVACDSGIAMLKDVINNIDIG